MSTSLSKEKVNEKVQYTFMKIYGKTRDTKDILQHNKGILPQAHSQHLPK